MLTDGYFIRGAVVKGRLYHDDRMAFGEALIKAYQYETTVVRYPRIMVLSDVLADTRQLAHIPKVFGNVFKQAAVAVRCGQYGNFHHTTKSCFQNSDSS